MITSHRFLIPFGVALLVAACGAGENNADRGTGWLAGDGKPVNLVLTFDAANGEAQVITPRGGRISTTGADGTRYQLEIPEGALLYDERISLIPVASVKKLPLKGGSIAAVHLKPEGLRLLKPATLRIRTETERSSIRPARKWSRRTVRVRTNGKNALSPIPCKCCCLLANQWNWFAAPDQGSAA